MSETGASRARGTEETRRGRLLGDRGVRAFLLVWVGQLVSLVGSGLTAFALGVWIYQSTASTTQYALVIFCAAVPPLVVLPFAGPIIDRWSRKRLLILCDVIAAAATVAVGVLAWLGALSLMHACLIVAVVSTAGALEGPTWAATVTLLVPREHLGRASGMTQLALAVSQIASPALAGMLITTIGLPGITAIDLVTFLVSIATLAAAAIPSVAGAGAANEHRPTPGDAAGISVGRPDRARRSYWHDMQFGWTYILGRAGLAALLLMFATVNFFSELAAVLFTPLVLTFSTPAALGTILATGGVGLISGGLLMSIWGGPRRAALGAVLFAAADGVAVATAGFTESVALLGAAAFGFFFCLPLITGCSQVIWQRIVPAGIQGRVFAARATVAMSLTPLAALVAGPLADRLCEPAMAPGGTLSALLGPVIGVGRGRGIALIVVAAGSFSVLAALAAGMYGPLRRLDEEPTSKAAPEPATA